MTDALDQRNQVNPGEPNDNVGQDENQTQQNESPTWEDQAKYFQSEKDKLYSENQKLKQYESVGKFLESRPDIVNNISEQLNGSGQPVQDASIRKVKKPDEFDPWEAYNDPSSESYQYREQEMKNTVNEAVQGAVKGVTESQKKQSLEMQKQVGVQKLQGELTQRGLNPQEIESFMQFASKNPAEYGVDNVIQMWRSVQDSGQTPANKNSNPLDQVRQTQQSPTQGGVLQGQQPQVKSDDDSMWKAILSAGGRNKF
jgi:hypothetical protein